MGDSQGQSPSAAALRMRRYRARRRKLSVPAREGRAALAAATEFLKSRLANGPASASEVQEQARAMISPITLRRAKQGLGVVADKAGFAGGWTWRLPGGKGG